MTKFVLIGLKSVHFKNTVGDSQFYPNYDASAEIKTKSADVLLKMIIILIELRT